MDSQITSETPFKRALTTKSQVEILDEDHSADANSFVFKMLERSVMQGASDAHIDLSLGERGQMGFKLRYRVDGRCFDQGEFTDITLYRGIVNKLKLDAGLKIDERRLPQDGRISFELEGKIYNFRISFMPNTIRNAQEEKIVLRQMADVSTCNLYQLEILPYYLALLEEAVKLPHGFICVTGPTGSGKTTTLYSLLKQVNRSEKNCMTLEDPVEAEIPLVNQSQMFHRIGYDFGTALRVILRQDPDVIMVGEMRDEETASKAFEAANTGHLVFSTLHTNTAASTITRLLQMRVPHYFISSSLKYVVAQRLLRRVCSDCKRRHPNEEKIFQVIEKTFENATKEVQNFAFKYFDQSNIFANNSEVNCHTCLNTGYRGRVSIMEIMKVDDAVRYIIDFEQGNEDHLQKAAEQNGMMTIQQYGYLQVLRGLTTFEEVNTAVLVS